MIEGRLGRYIQASGLIPLERVTTDRDAIKELLSLTQYVDVCMPRGGEG